MQNDAMSTRDKMTAGPAEKPAGDGVVQDGAHDTLGRLDDAQVMEIVSDAYWTLLERFISLDGEGTNIPSVSSAG